MPKRALILGGYGNFGKRIATALARHGVRVIIAGRNAGKISALVNQLPAGLADGACFDVTRNLDEQLSALKPAVVVDTCGPYQEKDYATVEACIRHKVHYIDLADGRDFVTGISRFHKQAAASGVAVVSGASTVPGLSSAVIEHFRGEFSGIDTLRFGISPGQQAERGLATTQAILGYVGKPLEGISRAGQPVYGWQDIYRQDYPELGRRWMANCDIPDLELLPLKYGIGEVRFSAGLELGVLHLGLWGLSWLVRAGLPLGLRRFAGPMLAASNWFNRFGTGDGGMHVIMHGRGKDGAPHARSWFIVAKNGHGPHIPTIPAILLARACLADASTLIGAQPCVGLVSLESYMDELKPYDVKTFVA